MLLKDLKNGDDFRDGRGCLSSCRLGKASSLTGNMATDTSLGARELAMKYSLSQPITA